MILIAITLLAGLVGLILGNQNKRIESLENKVDLPFLYDSGLLDQIVAVEKGKKLKSKRGK